ncbi:MAG: SpoIIE family protein phosphatase [Bdellovibrionia bacterium]
MISINTNLQANHQILNLFEQSKLRIESIIDHLPMFFAVINDKGIILKGNIQAAEIFQTDSEAILGKSLKSIFLPEALESFEFNFNRILAKSETSFELEINLQRSDKSQRVHAWRISEIENSTISSGRIFSIVGNDVTDFKKALSDLYGATKDLEVTRAVQSLLIPNKRELTTQSYRLVSSYQPATQSGGDWLWYNTKDENRNVLFIGDVTGHGAGPAMVTAIVAGCYHAISRLPNSKFTLGVRETFEIIDNSLKDLGNNDYWMTMSSLEIFHDKKEVSWSNAGAPSILVMRTNGEVETIGASGNILGGMDLALGHKSFDFNSGDRIFLFTDGAFEITTSTGGNFGLKGLRRLFMETRNLSLEESRKFFERRFVEIRGEAPPTDDSTFILIERI